MHHQEISQCTQSLENLETCLDKAAKYAAAKKFDVGVLLTSRLAPDMQPFTYQVQSACDYVSKARLRGFGARRRSRHEDTEQTIDELRARIRKTVAFAGERRRGAVMPGASERKVKLSWAPGKVIGGDDHLLQWMTVPNTFFHIATWPTPSFAKMASMSARRISWAISIWSTQKGIEMRDVYVIGAYTTVFKKHPA